MTSAGHLKFEKNEKKVSILNGGLLVGICGSVRFGNIFLHHCQISPYRKFYDEKGSEMNYLITHVAETIRKKSVDLGADRISENKQRSGSGIIFGLHGKIFALWPDYSITEHGPYYADGSGTEIALGSLYSTTKQKPKKRLKTAISGAAHLQPSLTLL